jgi:hypothetical protein
VEGIQVSSNEVDTPSQRGDNSKRVKKKKNTENFEKSSFPEPLKGQRGDNHKNGKIGWSHLKIFTRTTGPEELRLA